MKTTQYVRQETDFRPYLPWDHPEYVAWQTELEIETARIDAILSPGHLYVVQFISGVVKVGRSERPDRRIAQHAAMARVHGGGVQRSWTSAEHYCTATTERELIEYCGRNGQLIAGREYFKVPFDLVRSRASLLAANRLSPVDLAGLGDVDAAAS